MKISLIKEDGLQCYACSHYEGCGPDEAGNLVTCQMEDPREPHYGDACEVAHSVSGKIA